MLNFIHIYSIELLGFVVVLNALLVEVFTGTVALSILSARGICSSCVNDSGVCVINLLTTPPEEQ